MSYRSRIRSKKGKLKKRVLFLMVFMPVFLLSASFFVIAAASSSQSQKDMQLWNENKVQVINDYENQKSISDIAGIIEFDDKNIVPFYSNIEMIEDGASLFGSTLPGQNGRTIILGYNEQGFSYLSKIKVGDKILIDCIEGEYTYIVQSINVAVPSEIPLDGTDESVLTLVGKYPLDRRYVVEAVLN